MVRKKGKSIHTYFKDTFSKLKQINGKWDPNYEHRCLVLNLLCMFPSLTFHFPEPEYLLAEDFIS